MDAIFPYLVRRTPAAEPSQRLIEPVTKYTRFSPDEHGHHHEIWQYRISERHEQSRQQQHSPEQQDPQQQSQQQSKPAEPQYLPTSHAVTPEDEQHADADGHLDIYV
jgi:TFIIF-interacting CTD phosphatase-like protein